MITKKQKIIVVCISLLIVGFLVFEHNRAPKISFNTSDAAGNTITLNPSVTYQTMRGWEATTPPFDFVTSTTLDQVVAAGINRVRLEVSSGSENPIDYYGNWQGTLGGVETPDPVAGSSPEADAYIRNWYLAVNDDSDPNHINPAGFHWTALDQAIDRAVNPLRSRLTARGEHLYVNLCNVAFVRSGDPYLHANPAEYAEYMLATFQHIQQKYGWVPDSVDVMLEPDNRPQFWNGTVMGNIIVATGARLAAAGYHPDFIGPSTTDTHNAWFFIDDMLAVPGVMTYLKEFSYHRYADSDPVYVAGVGTRAAAQGIGGSMLEWWTPSNTYDTLYEDLTLGNNSAWQRGTTVTGSADLEYLQHYFSHVRIGAVRIGASSSDSALAPLAWINTNGTYAVVVKATSGGSFTVGNLPAGTYGIRYTTASQIDAANTDQNISSGQAVTTTIPAAGVIVVYGKTGGSTPPPPPPPPPGPPPPPPPPPSPPPGGMPVATDAFNRADANNLGSNWTSVYGGNSSLNGGSQGIKTNKAYSDGATYGRSVAYWKSNSFNNDQYSQFTVESLNSGNSAFATVRTTGAAGAANGSGYEGYLDGTIVKMTPNGNFTQLAAPVGGGNSGDVIRLNIVGNVLTLYRNGTQISTATDSSFTSGSPGIGWNWFDYTPTIDNWEGGNLTTSSGTPLAGDLNLDHIINSLDWSIMNSKWFTNDATADINHDGIVNAIDFSILNSNWFKTW